MSEYSIRFCGYLSENNMLAINSFFFLKCRKVAFAEVRNDSEPNTRYVRVMNPKAAEISFVRTSCEKKQALYVSCANLGLLSFHFFACKTFLMQNLIFAFGFLVVLLLRRLWHTINIGNKPVNESIKNGFDG